MFIIGGNHLGGRIIGKEFGENNIRFVCKTGRNAAHFSQNCWGHDVKIYLHPFDVNNLGGRTFGKEFLGNIFGAIGIFVRKTGRDAAHFPQNCWGNDVKIYAHPFDVNHFWGRTFGKDFLGMNCWGHWYLCV